MIPLMFDILPKAYAQNMQPVLMLGSAKTRLGVRKLQGDVSERFQGRYAGHPGHLCFTM